MTNLSHLIPALLFVPPTAALAILTSKREPPYIDPRKGFTEWKGGAQPVTEGSTVAYFLRFDPPNVAPRITIADFIEWRHPNNIVAFKLLKGELLPPLTPDRQAALESIGAFARALAEKPKRSRAKSSTRKKRAA